MPNEAMTLGSAVFTIVESSTTMKVLIMMFVSTHHLYDSCSWWSDGMDLTNRRRSMVVYFEKMRTYTDRPGRSAATSGEGTRTIFTGTRWVIFVNSPTHCRAG